MDLGEQAPRRRTIRGLMDVGVTPAWAVETIPSRAWEGPAPRASVLIATFERRKFLPGIAAALEDQDIGLSQFEVIIVDDHSADDTWEELDRIASETKLRLLAMRHDSNRGPATTRNTALSVARGDVICFTDDDCLPSTSWVSMLSNALTDGVEAAQGLVEPPPDDFARAGPWDHTIWVHHPSPFFETANVAYRRSRLLEIGGFAENDPLLRPGHGRHFGEDAVLGWRVLEAGGDRAFVPEARVLHRVLPRTYGQWLNAQRATVRFPGLARRSPLLREWLTAGVFLTPSTALFDMALLGMTAASALGQPVALAAVLPWAWRRVRVARHESQQRPLTAVRLLVMRAVGDLVTFVSLLVGSIRHGRLVL